MRFTYNKQQYRIRFRHGAEINKIKGFGDRLQDYCIAAVLIGDYNPNLAEKILCEAEVRRYAHDVHNPATARVKALAAALTKIESRAFRVAVWTCYHSRPGGLLDFPRLTVEHRTRPVGQGDEPVK